MNELWMVYEADNVGQLKGGVFESFDRALDQAAEWGFDAEALKAGKVKVQGNYIESNGVSIRKTRLNQFEEGGD